MNKKKRLTSEGEDNLNEVSYFTVGIYRFFLKWKKNMSFDYENFSFNFHKSLFELN